MRLGFAVLIMLLMNHTAALLATANEEALSWSYNLLQLDFQHDTITTDSDSDSDDHDNQYGLFANGAGWLPDENGISQSLRESIRQESLRILNQALPVTGNEQE